MARDDNSLPPLGGPPRQSGAERQQQSQQPQAAAPLTLQRPPAHAMPPAALGGTQPVTLMVQDKATGALVPFQWDSVNGGVPLTLTAGFPHSSLSGLTTGDDHTQYSLNAGRVGGQTHYGGTAAGNKLTLRGNTADADGGMVDLKRINLTDNGADPLATGELCRNAATLKWHDGTAVRQLLTTAAAVTVAQGGTGLTSTTAYGVICGGTTTTGNLQNAGAGLSTQILISQGAAALPTWNTVSGDVTISASGVTAIGATKVTNAMLAGSITAANLVKTDITTLSALVSIGTITTGVWNGTAVDATHGGTAQTTWTLGDLLYASGSNALSKLAGNASATNKFLTQTGTGTVSAAPAWATIVAGDLPNHSAALITSGTLALNVGGTNANLTAANGGIVWSNATQLQILGAGTSGQILRSGGAATPAWSTPTFPNTAASANLMIGDGSNWVQNAVSGDVTIGATGITAIGALKVTNAMIAAATIDLAAKVTGVLPIANGGNNSSTALGGGRPVISNATAIVESTGYLRKTGTYTVAIGDCEAVIDVDTTAGGANAAVTINLPAASSVGLGFRVTIGNSLTVASGTAVNAVSIVPNGADCIDGTAVTHKLNAQYSKMVLRSTGVAGAGTGKGWIVESAEDWLSSNVGATSCTFNTATNVTTITLTPGEWYISGYGSANLNTLTSLTSCEFGVSVVSATFGTVGDSAAASALPTAGASVNVSCPAWRRLTVAATETAYLVMQFNAASGAGTIAGRITAQRVR